MVRGKVLIEALVVSIVLEPDAVLDAHKALLVVLFAVVVQLPITSIRPVTEQGVLPRQTRRKGYCKTDTMGAL